MDTYQKDFEELFKTANKYKESLRDTINKIEVGYKYITYMYITIFLIGIFLILISVVFAFLKEKEFLSLVFGGIGGSIVGYFIFNPPKDIQESRANLAQLEAAFFYWFYDIYIWYNYLVYLYSKEPLNFEDVEKVSNLLFTHTEKMMNIIERYCELEPIDKNLKVSNLKKNA